MFRRRPLARAAVVGGVAYGAAKMGSRSAQSEAAEQQQYAPPPPPAPAEAPAGGGMTDDSMERLQKLAELHTQGVLTDAEFEVQKEKILQGM